MSSLLITHIPKSAGSSLMQLVGRLNPDTVWVYRRELALATPDLAFAQAFRQQTAPSVVMGHFSYGVHRLLGLAPAYATVLREPVDRVVSLYRYQRTLPDSAFREAFDAGMTLEQFVTSGITEQTNNHACRVIAGIAPEEGMQLHAPWLLELAIHRLEQHFVLAGVMEDIGPTLVALGQRLGWPAVQLPKVNVTPGKALVLSPREHAAIIANNQLDRQLYAYVVQRRLGLPP